VAQVRLRHRQQRPCPRIIRIDFNHAAADAHHPLFAAKVADIAGEPILPREKVEVVSLRALGATLLDCPLLFGQELEPQRSDDCSRNLILDCEDVREIAVEAIGPDVASSLPIDQLGVDPHPVSDLANASFEDMSDAELLCYVTDVHRLALEGEGRIPGYDLERGHFG